MYNNPYPYAQQDLPNAGLALVLALVSVAAALFCGCIPVGPVLAIIALIKANEDRALYRAEPERYTASSYSQANAGRIISIVGLGLFGVGVLVFFVAMLLGMLKELNAF